MTLREIGLFILFPLGTALVTGGILLARRKPKDWSSRRLKAYGEPVVPPVQPKSRIMSEWKGWRPNG